MSAGIATPAEIDEGVRTLREAGSTQQALLKCTSACPSLPEYMKLRTIPHLGQAFGLLARLSDHTLGIALPVVAVVMGACIVEKHLTLRRSTGGPGAAFSLEPAEFNAMVAAVQVAEKAQGRMNCEVTEKEIASRVFRRSLFLVKDTQAGEVFTRKNIRSIRPGCGLASKHLDQVLGRKAVRDVAAGTLLSSALIGGVCDV